MLGLLLLRGRSCAAAAAAAAAAIIVAVNGDLVGGPSIWGWGTAGGCVILAVLDAWALSRGDGVLEAAGRCGALGPARSMLHGDGGGGVRSGHTSFAPFGGGGHACKAKHQNPPI
eukprot:scaffold124070_cov19-Tisochrysis_lutea.AAC.2